MFVVNPGELVWLPDEWPHMTMNIDDAVYVYRASCKDDYAGAGGGKGGKGGRGVAEGGVVLGRDDPMLHMQAARRVCEETGRFCEGYCFYFCNGCDGRKCECEPLKKVKKKRVGAS